MLITQNGRCMLHPTRNPSVATKANAHLVLGLERIGRDALSPRRRELAENLRKYHTNRGEHRLAAVHELGLANLNNFRAMGQGRVDFCCDPQGTERTGKGNRNRARRGEPYASTLPDLYDDVAQRT